MSQSRPALIVGIDIGKDLIHVATGLHDKVEVLDLADQIWIDRLEQLVAPGAVVALEPTGWYYSAPVITALQHLGAVVLMVEHRTTGETRSLHINKHMKTDGNDARALFFVALQHAQGTPVLGTRPAEPDLELRAASLRLLVLAHHRSTKEFTRSLNRLHQVAHALWPVLGLRLTTYLHAVDAGYITPADLRDLAGRFKRGKDFYPTDFHDGRLRRYLVNLIAQLPPWLDMADPNLRQVIRGEADNLTYHQQRAADLVLKISQLVQAPPFDELTRLWQTVPGAGLLGIAALQGATHGQAAHMTAPQMRACCGCHSVIEQSGKEKKSKLTKQGFRPARAALHLWVMTLIEAGKNGQPNPVSVYFERRKSQREKFAMAASRAKLVNILSGIARTGTPYIDAAPESAAQED